MQPQQKQVSLDQTTGVVCELCSHDVFANGVFIRKVSKFLTGSPQDSIIPSPTLYCVKCLHVNAEFHINSIQGEEA